jgi:hypothetical protein
MSTRLNPDQQWFLKYGPNLMPAGSPDMPFADETAAKQAWQKHKTELMAHCQPGQRPWGFWYDLGIDPVDLYEEIAALLDRDLIDEEEAVAIEARVPFLGEKAHSICAVSTSQPSHSNGQSRLSVAVLARRDALAAKWHLWRGRPECANNISTQRRIVMKNSQQRVSEAGGRVRSSDTTRLAPSRSRGSGRRPWPHLQLELRYRTTWLVASC